MFVLKLLGVESRLRSLDVERNNIFLSVKSIFNLFFKIFFFRISSFLLSFLGFQPLGSNKMLDCSLCNCQWRVHDALSGHVM